MAPTQKQVLAAGLAVLATTNAAPAGFRPSHPISLEASNSASTPFSIKNMLDPGPVHLAPAQPPIILPIRVKRADTEILEPTIAMPVVPQKALEPGHVEPAEAMPVSDEVNEFEVLKVGPNTEHVTKCTII